MSENKANIGPKIVLEGEAEYRQSISNVNKSMSVMKSELKAVTAEYKDNANSVEALKAKNEILLRQQTEQEKKLQLLRGALERSAELYGKESAQVQNWQIKLNDAYADLKKLNREIESNTKYLKEAEGSADKTATSIDKYGKEIKTAGNNADKAGSQFKANLSSAAVIAGIAGLGAAIKKVSDSVVDLVKSTASYADEILTLSAQTGIATDTLQELNYMQELTDVSVETVTNSMAKNIRSMASAQKGTENYIKAYKSLQVEYQNADGSLRNSSEVFWEVIDALGQMTNETERDATSMKLLGKSAQDINPLIKIGTAGMAEFSREAHNMGAVLSSETLQKLGETDDALQRMYQQIEASKRSIGADIAPAVTESFEKITEKIDEVDDKFAGFAEGSIGAVVDGFIWIIDNASVITAGLKGIAAGIITKQAADGINYAVTAYKTLTTATEAATAAQVGLNTVTKASVIGAIASIVIGAGTAIYSYAKSASDAAEETRKLNDENQKLIDGAVEVTQTVEKNIEDRKKSLKTISDEAGATLKLVDSLYDLYKEEGRSNESKQQMLSLVEQINEAMPDLNLSIDEQTGLINKQREEVEKLVQAQIELSTAEALKGELANIALEKYNQEQALNDLLEVQKNKRKELEELTKNRNDYRGGYTSLQYGVDQEAAKLTSEIDRLNKELDENASEIELAEKAVKDLGLSYEEALKYIGDHSEIDGATDALNKFLNKYKETLDAQNEAYAEGLDDRVDAVKESYEESEDLLDKSQKAERKALEKTQKEQVQALEDATDDELEILEKAHEKKLGLINDEYLEKMKLVDEDRYNELKNVQDQIDALDTQQAAEDKARALREEAEKRAELTSQVENAKTADEKLKAQQELADFEKETAEDRLKTERDLQKSILEEQKKTINDAYDAKIKTLEEEKKTEEENANKKFEDDKQDIADRLKTKQQELADIQELEMTYLEEKQDAERKAADSRKEYAVKKAKETYEEDLAQFKLNNALKYEDAVDNEEKIRKAMQETALKYSTNPFDINNVSFDFETLKGLRFNTDTNFLKAGSTQIDYDKMADVFVEAVKQQDWTIVLDKKVVGKFIEGRVNEMVK